MSLNFHDDRWYLLAQHNTTASHVIIAAETTGSIVGRIRIAWIYDYGPPSDSCNRTEGPVLSIDRKWLFVSSRTGIVIIADNGQSASLEQLISLPNICARDMAFSEIDSTLLVVESNAWDLLVLNVSTLNTSVISLTNICDEQVVGQLSRMTVIQDQRFIVVVITASRKAVLLLVDYQRRILLARRLLGYVPSTAVDSSLTQLAYTRIDDTQAFVTIAHPSIGVMAVRLQR